jgi:hypothetical protein
MLSYSSESEFATYLTEINRYKAVGNYEQLLVTIKKAKDCELIMHQPTTSTMFAIPTKKVCSAGRQLQR